MKIHYLYKEKHNLEYKTALMQLCTNCACRTSVFCACFFCPDRCEGNLILKSRNIQII